MSDRIALIAMDWLRDRGLGVPRGCIDVGFDGVPEAELSEPALTTVTQPIKELGRRAGAGHSGSGGPMERETLPVELTVRGSTAAPLALRR